MEGLAHGFAVALTPVNLLWALAGATLGTAVGVLPGIGPALTVALLLPLTYDVNPTAALILFAGIYYGAMYGGSTTSILLNTPGESATMVTALEGHEMARRGRAGAALSTAAIGSFVAGTLATLGLSLTAPALVRVALRFGPAEYFALVLMAFALICRNVGPSPLRGLTSLCLGIVLGLVGIDALSGQARLTMGIPYLLDGIDVVIVAVGLFAVGEALTGLARGEARSDLLPVGSRISMSADDWSRSWKPWLRGTAIGFPLGALPAGGAAAGTLVPLLTLGLPTSATAAVLLAAFQQFGLQPGPLLFEREPDLVWGVIASLYIGNVMLLVLNLPLVRLWVKLLTIPKPELHAGILVVATLGAYSVHRSVGDLLLLTSVGLLGYGLRRFEMPVAPVMIGLILGPVADQQLRRALAISGGDWSVLVTRPIAASLLVIALMVAVWRTRPSRGPAPPEGPLCSASR